MAKRKKEFARPNGGNLNERKEIFPSRKLLWNEEKKRSPLRKCFSRFHHNINVENVKMPMNKREQIVQ